MDKNRKRAKRRHDLWRHYRRRLQRFKVTSNTGIIVLPKDLSEQAFADHYEWLTVYKSTGTPCSCEGCTGGKYDRLKDKKAFDREIRRWKEGIDEIDT